ncbi:MAG: hypothetical protein U0931_07960 [Vulcanimicrobiota bacterium]
MEPSLLVDFESEGHSCKYSFALSLSKIGVEVRETLVGFASRESHLQSLIDECASLVTSELPELSRKAGHMEVVSELCNTFLRNGSKYSLALYLPEDHYSLRTSGDLHQTQPWTISINSHSQQLYSLELTRFVCKLVRALNFGIESYLWPKSLARGLFQRWSIERPDVIEKIAQNSLAWAPYVNVTVSPQRRGNYKLTVNLRNRLLDEVNIDVRFSNRGIHGAQKVDEQIQLWATLVDEVRWLNKWKGGASGRKIAAYGIDKLPRLAGWWKLKSIPGKPMLVVELDYVSSVGGLRAFLGSEGVSIIDSAFPASRGEHELDQIKLPKGRCILISHQGEILTRMAAPFPEIGSVKIQGLCKSPDLGFAP